MNPTLAPLNADDHGFFRFEELVRHAAETTRGQFVTMFPDPALLVVHRDDSAGGAGELVDPNDTRIQLLTVSIKSAAILRYLNKIAFVRKRPGNPYAHLISIGRSANNDIVMQIDTVSKVHGYFVRQDEGWFFTDHSSTNGSQLNDEKLRSGDKYTLRDHDVLQLGLEVTVEFLAPESLYDKLREG